MRPGPAVVIPSAWLGVALVNGLQNYLVARLHGNAVSPLEAFAHNLFYLVVWAAATPAILSTVGRLPARGSRLARNGLLHVGFASLFSMILGMVSIRWLAWTAGVGLSLDEWLRRAAASTARMYHLDVIVYLVIVALCHVRRSSRPTEIPAPRLLDRIAVRHHYRVHLVAVRDVDWIEASDDHVVIHTNGEHHRLRGTLKRLHARLDPARFVRVHRSAVVNVDRIVEVQPYLHGDYVAILAGGTQLRVSRTRRAALEESWARRCRGARGAEPAPHRADRAVHRAARNLHHSPA